MDCPIRLLLTAALLGTLTLAGCASDSGGARDSGRKAPARRPPTASQPSNQRSATPAPTTTESGGESGPRAVASDGSFVGGCRAWLSTHRALPARRGIVGAPDDGVLIELFATATRADIDGAMKQNDPSIRQLAVGAAVFGDDPTLLGGLGPALTDDRPCLPVTQAGSGVAEVFESGGRIGDRSRRARTTPTTVSRYARSLLSEWLDAPPEQLAEILPQLDTPESARASVSGWRFRLRRAELGAWDGATTDRSAATSRLVADIRRDAPPAVAALVLLGTVGGEGLLIDDATARELATRSLTRSETFALLRGERLLDDPLLAASQGSVGEVWRRTCANVLVFRDFTADDSGQLIDVARANAAAGRAPLPELYVAAAAALPGARDADAIKILRDAVDRFPEPRQDAERWVLFGALWGRAGLAQATFLMDQMFAEDEPRTNQGGTQEAVIGLVTASDPAAARGFIRGLLEDSRAESLNWGAMLQLVWQIHELSGREVIPDREWRGLNHPAGPGLFARSEGAKLRAQYPDETETVNRTLGTWRVRLREFVKEHGW